MVLERDSRVRPVIEKLFKWNPPIIKLPSRGWVDEFKRRNNLKHKVAEEADVKTKDHATSGTIEAFFDKTLKSINLENIPPELQFNADEFMASSSFKEYILTPHNAEYAKIKKQGTNEHISGIVTFNSHVDIKLLYSLL